ncbi:mucin-7-like [Panicum virgatum]|uniref:mucin-7-like n=1 Tax=Panicum virgatum TaxID=38727 RepID=UPI0019D6A220|nr:mucin-7-like [Panicum virgatum]
MSGPPPAPSVSTPTPPISDAPPFSSAGAEPGSTTTSEASSPAGAPITLESLSTVVAALSSSVADLLRGAADTHCMVTETNRNVAALQTAWSGLLQPPPPPHPAPPPPPPPSTTVASTSGPRGVPLHQISWPASPSLIPSWATGSQPMPVYTTTKATTTTA